MKNLRINFYVVFSMVGLFISLSVCILMFFQFRNFTEDSYFSTLKNVAVMVEKHYPVLHDIDTMKEAFRNNEDWIWEMHGEWIDILNAFDLAYIYYTERTPDGEYLDIMDTYYTRDMDIKWLGSEVWEDDPIPDGIDDAWNLRKITFSPEPSVEEQWGTVVSTYFPVVSDGQTVGILGVDYDISYVKGLENRVLAFLIISFAASAIFTVLLAMIGSRSLLISIEERERIAIEANERRKEIENLMDALKNTSSSRTAFLSNISTQMANPINTIIKISSLISVDKELSAHIKKHMDVINDSGLMLYEVVADIVDILKIESGKLKITPGKYELPNLINDITAPYTMHAEGRPIKYKVLLDDKLPLKLIGDAHRIRHICSHLLNNAFKFTLEGTISVDISCKPKNGYVSLIIEITDTGVGMTEEELQNLFAGYGQVDAADKFHKGGTGLGLSIAKQIAELMKGTLTATSVKNEGSVFTLSVPQKLVSEETIGKAIAETLVDFQYDKH